LLDELIHAARLARPALLECEDLLPVALHADYDLALRQPTRGEEKQRSDDRTKRLQAGFMTHDGRFIQLCGGEIVSSCFRRCIAWIA
jgi:hypothetical protein